MNSNKIGQYAVAKLHYSHFISFTSLLFCKVSSVFDLNGSGWGFSAKIRLGKCINSHLQLVLVNMNELYFPYNLELSY